MLFQHLLAGQGAGILLLVTNTETPDEPAYYTGQLQLWRRESNPLSKQK